MLCYSFRWISGIYMNHLKRKVPGAASSPIGRCIFSKYLFRLSTGLICILSTLMCAAKYALHAFACVNGFIPYHLWRFIVSAHWPRQRKYFTIHGYIYRREFQEFQTFISHTIVNMFCKINVDFKITSMPAEKQLLCLTNAIYLRNLIVQFYQLIVGILCTCQIVK